MKVNVRNDSRNQISSVYRFNGLCLLLFPWKRGEMPFIRVGLHLVPPGPLLVGGAGGARRAGAPLQGGELETRALTRRDRGLVTT